MLFWKKEMLCCEAGNKFVIFWFSCVSTFTVIYGMLFWKKEITLFVRLVINLSFLTTAWKIETFFRVGIVFADIPNNTDSYY